MTEQTPCPRCRRDTTDGLLCHPCTNTYQRARDQLARYATELATAWQRQDNVNRGIIHGKDRSLELAQAEAAEQAQIPARLRTRDQQVALPANPLPVNLDAGQLRKEALHLLRSLPRSVAALRGAVDAPGIVDAVQRLARRAEHAIDARPPELFVGPCDTPDVTTDIQPADEGDTTITVDVAGVCGVELYARPGDTEVTCHACGYVYPIEERRAWLLDSVRNLLERPKIIAQALASLDMPITAALLDTWISRDLKLHRQGRTRPDGLPLILADPVYDDGGKPLYRVGDVIDRVEAARPAAPIAN